MRKLILLTVIFFLIFSNIKAQDTTQLVIKNRFNSTEQQEKPYVILISLDGFRWDLADKFNAKNLIKLREMGVKADYLKPSFPSLTFPNHYSIVTGLYPSHHGIVNNIFYDKARDVIFKKADREMAIDSSWYNGKPLWVLAEEQKMLSAVFYWPSSEISMNGIKPTYLFNYSEIIPLERRINVVKDWLNLPAQKRPHFIALYFPQVDKAAHENNPDSEETKAAVQLLDNAIGKLVEVADNSKLPINFIVLSDHGMTTVDRENTISLPKAIDVNKFIVPPGNSLLNVYAKDQKDIKSTYKAVKAEAKDYKVYLSKNIPKAWHYNKSNDTYNRVGDLILVPQLPKVFNINNNQPDAGQHGFDPSITDMHAIFYAWGPNFKSGLKIPAFENVNVYSLIAKILGLNYTHKIDGKEKILKHALRD